MGPDLGQYINKRLNLHLNGSRKVQGTLKGFDVFLNVVLEDAVELKGENPVLIGTAVVRGDSVLSLQEVN